MWRSPQWNNLRHSKNCPQYNDFVKLFHDGGYQPANPGKTHENRNKIGEVSSKNIVKGDPC